MQYLERLTTKFLAVALLTYFVLWHLGLTGHHDAAPNAHHQIEHVTH
jgi:hypothetical protein